MNTAASSGVTPEGVIGVIALIAAYWAPTIIAAVRRVQGIGSVVVVNLFTGWTVIGWVVALGMAFRHVPRPAEGQVLRPPNGV